jgi:putative NADH-flavin reductase
MVFGANGGTGRELVSQALKKGHDVSAFVRTPGKLAVVGARLRAVQGDIERAETIQAAIPGHVGETRGQLGPFYNWLLVPLLLRNVFADKERQEAVIRATALDWTIVQPASLTNGSQTGTYRAGDCTGRLFPKVSRSDVAHFMIEELENPRHVRQTVPLCY